jgi:DNA-binding GntR family transcriptional regulator
MMVALGVALLPGRKCDIYAVAQWTLRFGDDPVKKLAIPDNLTAMAYKSIKEYILEGPLDSESRLTEEYLSGQLGISKSPIREALNRLETEGLIRIEPRRGAYLRSYTAEEGDELYDFREALEVHVIRRAKLTPALLKVLWASIEKQRTHLKAGDALKYIHEDINFHAKLAASTGNSMLCKELERLQNIIWLFRRDKRGLLSSEALDGHQSIVTALECGTRDEAEDAMRRHISRVRHTLLEESLAHEVAAEAMAST